MEHGNYKNGSGKKAGKSKGPETVEGPEKTDQDIDWGNVIEVGANIGQRPDQTMQQTLPELTLAIRGWRRMHGLDADDKNSGETMSRDRLMALIQEENSNGNC